MMGEQDGCRYCPSYLGEREGEEEEERERERVKKRGSKGEGGEREWKGERIGERERGSKGIPKLCSTCNSTANRRPN